MPLREQRPESGSSRSAWNDDGLDAPGRPISSGSSNGGQRDIKSAKSVSAANVNPGEKVMKKKRVKKAAKKENICSRIIHAIWSTRYTEDLSDNEKKAKTILRELIVYLLYIIIIYICTYEITNVSMFQLKKAMTDLFVDRLADDHETSFSGLASQSDFFTFAEGPLLDGLYWETYYNDKNVNSSDLGYIYFENKLLGVPRIRQLRVRNDSCLVHSLLKAAIPACYGEWSSSNSDQNSYGLHEDPAWVYHDEDKMNGTSSQDGVFADYPGAGFYQDLARTKAESADMIETLKKNRWLDRGTRVVFIDFTMYNPNVNLFCVIRLITEFSAIGEAWTSPKINTVRLLRYLTVGDYIIMGCEFVFIAFVLYYFVEECLEIKNQGFKNYFTEFWNWMDAVVIVISLIAIAYNIYMTFTVKAILDQLLSNPDQFPDFWDLVTTQTGFNNLVAILSFLAMVKLFKYVSFNKIMSQLTDTISRAKKDLAGFLLMFIIVFFAFAQAAYLFFGTQLNDYRNVLYAMLSQFRIILGDFSFPDLMSAHPYLGPFWFIMFVLVVFFILFNMFLAIINDTYSSVKGDDSAHNEFEVMDFFKGQYNKLLEKLNIKRDKLSDIQDALQMADDNSDNKVEFEEWKAQLLSRGYKDEDIEEAFKKFDLDNNRVLDADEQAKMLKVLEDEKNQIDQEIGKVETKLGNPRPSTVRPQTTRSKRAQENEETGSPTPTQPTRASKTPRVVSEVGYGEFTQLQRRVERMEHSVGSIVSKIDTVLVKLEGMEKAKLRRREAMIKLLDGIAGADDANETEKKEQLERLVREELERWDSEAVVSRPASSMSRPATSHSRAASAMK